MTTSPEIPGPRVYTQPIPEARQLRRALESLGVTSITGKDRSDPAILVGVLSALTEQYRHHLDGEDITKAQFGWMFMYDHDERRVLAQTAANIQQAGEFADAGIEQVPAAARPLRIAALAARCAHWATAAAAEIAGADSPDDHATGHQYTERALQAGRNLGTFVAKVDELRDLERRAVAGDPSALDETRALADPTDEQPPA